MNTLHYYLIIFFLLIGTHHLQAQHIHDHKLWDELLQMYVDGHGGVDYEGILKDKAKLEAYLEVVNAHPPESSWTQQEKKAYLINAYNAFTVQLIIENYPLESIRDIGWVLNNPFTTEFAKIGGKSYSLDDIEKGMLLKMGDPRVHFAINCASASCPKLLNEAYIASKLEQQLEASTFYFINSKENKLAKTEVELSKIFKWYASDFETRDSSVLKFINAYSKTQVDPDATISYLDYSWKLNSK